MLSATTFLITLSIMHQSWAQHDNYAPPPPAPPPPAPPPPAPPPPAPPPPTRNGGCQSEGVGFSASKAEGGISIRAPNRGYLISAPTEIKFQDTLSRFGDMSWDKTKFCVHCPGYYFFSFHAQSSDQEDFTVSLMKNGIQQVSGYGSKNGYQWAGNSAMVNLNNNDCVWLTLTQGSIYEHPDQNEDYTTFTGFLVAPLR